jgi:hypothetical protein
MGLSCMLLAEVLVSLVASIVRIPCRAEVGLRYALVAAATQRPRKVLGYWPEVMAVKVRPEVG